MSEDSFRTPNCAWVMLRAGIAKPICGGKFAPLSHCFLFAIFRRKKKEGGSSQSESNFSASLYNFKLRKRI